MKTHSSLLFCQMNDLFFCYLILSLELTLFQISGVVLSSFFSLFFILFTAFVLRKSTEQGKLEKSPRSGFPKPVPTTTPAPCTALPVAPTPSLHPRDFLKGTHLCFKLRFSSGLAQGTRTWTHREIPTAIIQAESAAHKDHKYISSRTHS